MLVLADDLTSALDAIAPFAARGWNACVMLNDHVVPPDIESITARDLNSRFLDSASARSAFKDAAGVPAGCVLFKTVDSTLRGNVAAEIDGTLAGSGRQRAVFAPAFPTADRMTIGGRQLLGGVPIDRSSFGADPRTPVTTSLLADLLPRCDGTIVPHDAASDADLDAIVVAESDPAAVLWVGSPGLAAALARRFRQLVAANRVAMPSAERILVVVGSAHPASRAQVAHLAAADVPVIEVSADEAAASGALRVALRGGVTVLAAPAARTADPVALVRTLARVTATARAHIDGIVVTGGETARHVLLALGAERLQVAGEIEPGVPFGVAHGGDHACAFVTKAGGFGGATTLAECIDRLRKGTR